MKVFTRREVPEFFCPSDMKVILTYLKSIGDIHVTPKTIEELYFKFCSIKYGGGWLDPREEILEEFAAYLEGLSVEIVSK